MRGEGSFRKQLSSSFYDQSGQVASANALTDALVVLDAQADLTDPQPVFQRVAPTDDGVLIDLGRPDLVGGKGTERAGEGAGHGDARSLGLAGLDETEHSGTRFDDADDGLDKSVAQTWATLLDEGLYLASMSTMHRVLRGAGQSRERRRQATHPTRVRPELLATKPGQVWTWDITKLRGPGRGVYFDLYVVLDIFSRYVVGWTVAAREDADLAKNLLEQAMTVHGRPVSVHADRNVDDLKAGRAAAGRPRRRSQPQQAAREQRQPLQRGALQDPQVRPGLPRPVRLASPTPARSARSSSPTTTMSTGTAASGCTRPPRSTTAPPPKSGSSDLSVVQATRR